MSFKIEKNVPMPMRGVNGGLASTLRRMEVGDSFVVNADSNTFRNSLYTTARRIGINVTSRVIAPTTLRVWRVEGEPATAQGAES